MRSVPWRRRGTSWWARCRTARWRGRGWTPSEPRGKGLCFFGDDCARCVCACAHGTHGCLVQVGKIEAASSHAHTPRAAGRAPSKQIWLQSHELQSESVRLINCCLWSLDESLGMLVACAWLKTVTSWYPVGGPPLHSRRITTHPPLPALSPIGWPPSAPSRGGQRTACGTWRRTLSGSNARR